MERDNRKKILNFFSAVKWCLSISWATSKLYTVVRIGVEIITPLFTIIAAYTGKYLIDLLAYAHYYENSSTALIILFAILLAITLLRIGGQKLQQYCRAMHEDLVSNEISLIIMERSLSVDLEYYDNPKYYDKLQAANRDSYSIVGIAWYAMSFVSACISCVIAFIALGNSNLLYGLLMIAAALPSSLAATRYTKLVYKLSIEQISGQRQMGYCQRLASEKLYAQDIRLFDAGYKLKNRYKRIWEELFTERKGVTRRRALLMGLLECLPEIFIIAIGLDIAYKILSGVGTVGDYSLYTGLAGQLWSAVARLSYSVMQIYDNKLKIENFQNLSQFQSHVPDNGSAPLAHVGTVEFVNVHFTYPGANFPALRGATFDMKQEEKVALVGLNGSGKSTLIKLLLRMYDPDSGMIRINGKDIREYSISALRKNFSVYFQDMHNYCFSIRENFTIADSERTDTDQAVLAAIADAYGSDILRMAHKGLDTNIMKLFDSDGIELSGGQHQKLALARAFYRRHTALVLDEPSASLDPKAEHEIFDFLRNFSDGKLTIFTSHRLSNVSLADRVIVLENGQVVEDGTQEELLKRKQKYSELFRYQQEKYIVKDDEDVSRID